MRGGLGAEEFASNMAHQTGPSGADNTRTKIKEILMRHYDLEQTKDKAQAAIVSILFMTQITELKMLLDIGSLGHRFYNFVLAMLIASIGLLIFVGMLIMYISNLRHNQESKRNTCKDKCTQCLLCRYRITCPCTQKPKRNMRASSYISVPIGESISEVQPAPAQEEPAKPVVENDEEEEEITGCCQCQFPPPKKEGELRDLSRMDGRIDGLRLHLNNAVVKLVRTTNRLEEIDNLAKKNPANREMQEEARQAKAESLDAKREKDAAESELLIAEEQRMKTYMEKEQREDKEEQSVFKTVTFWQKSTNYLLYFICLMNVFITAFGIYGGKSTFGPIGDSTP